jgi:surface polysaccharide O-acyltransferase-like enzyme
MAQTRKMCRDTSVDLVKTFAIIGVLLIHTTAGVISSNQSGSLEWYTTLLWGSVSRASVPLFLMCSGVLFLAPEKDLPLKKLWGKYIARIAVALFVWAFFYKLFHLALEHNFSGTTLLTAIKDVFLFRHETHLYYLHIVLLVYALLPFLRLLVQYGSKQMLQYALLIWFLLGIVYPTVCGYWPFSRLSGIPLQWKLNMTYASLGYLLLGYYLKRYPPRKFFAVGCLLAGFTIVFGLTAVFSLQKGSLDSQFWEGMSVGVCLQAAGIFSLLTLLPTSPILSHTVHFVSKASFCIYLCHMMLLKLLGMHFSANWPIPALGIPLLTAATLAGSLVVYLVLSRIPIVNKWLL